MQIGSAALVGVPAGEHVPLGGQRAFVRTAGVPGDPPVVLLHGLGATAALNWAPCFGPLAASHRVIAPDLPGHGQGPRVGRRFRLEGCADHVAELIRASETRSAVVVGYSMGGPIAQLLAIRHPDVVDGLVLCATARDFRGRPADRLRFAAAAPLATASSVLPALPLAALVGRIPGVPGAVAAALSEISRHEPAALCAAADQLGRFTSRAWIGEVTVPSVVVVHGRDGIVPTRRQLKLAAALADCQIVALDADHAAPARRPEAFAAAVVSACTRVRRTHERVQQVA